MKICSQVMGAVFAFFVSAMCSDVSIRNFGISKEGVTFKSRGLSRAGGHCRSAVALAVDLVDFRVFSTL